VKRPVIDEWLSAFFKALLLEFHPLSFA